MYKKLVKWHPKLNTMVRVFQVGVGSTRKFFPEQGHQKLRLKTPKHFFFHVDEIVILSQISKVGESFFKKG